MTNAETSLARGSPTSDKNNFHGPRQRRWLWGGVEEEEEDGETAATSSSDDPHSLRHVLSRTFTLHARDNLKLNDLSVGNLVAFTRCLQAVERLSLTDKCNFATILAEEFSDHFSRYSDTFSITVGDLISREERTDPLKNKRIKTPPETLNLIAAIKSIPFQ